MIVCSVVRISGASVQPKFVNGSRKPAAASGKLPRVDGVLWGWWRILQVLRPYEA